MLTFAKDVQPKIFSYAEEPKVLQTLSNGDMGLPECYVNSVSQPI
jgi:hypothetical protein